MLTNDKTHEISCRVHELEDALQAAQGDRDQLREDATFFRNSANAWQQMGNRLWKLLTGQSVEIAPSDLEREVTKRFTEQAGK